MAGESDEEWLRLAREALAEVWSRRGARFAERLERHRLLRDPAEDLMTLAARRLLPVPGAIVRPLPCQTLERRSRAFCRLARADRILLWPWSETWVADLSVAARREHLVAAWSRLAHNAKTARRLADAPPLGPGSEPRLWPADPG